MNAYRIAIAILMIQTMIILAGFANIPVSCNPDLSSCVYFSETLVGTTTIYEVINGQFEQGQYKTTRIETNIFTVDVWQTAAVTVDKAINILNFSATGVFSLVRFFFGVSELTFWIGTAMQVVAHFFLVKAFVDMIRSGGKGDI
jgi:hypothetical protein